MDELKHMEVVSVELGSSRDVHSWALKVYALEKNTNVSVLVTVRLKTPIFPPTPPRFLSTLKRAIVPNVACVLTILSVNVFHPVHPH